MGRNNRKNTVKAGTRFVVGLICSSLVFSVSAEMIKWHPHVSTTLKPGSARQLNKVDYFLPFKQDNNSLLFFDFRGVTASDSGYEGNVGIAYRVLDREKISKRPPIYGFEPVRHWDDGDKLYGFYAFYDHRVSPVGYGYNQFTFGGEWMMVDRDIRGNLYLADGLDNVIASSRTQTPFLQGTQLMLTSEQKVAKERALSGYDLEYGQGHHYSWGDELWWHLGVFDFMHDETPRVIGPRVRVEYRQNDPFGWKQARLTWGGEYQYDETRGAQAYAALQLRYTFGEYKGKKGLSEIEKRMMESIVRDIDVVTFAEDINALEGDDTAPGIVRTVAPLKLKDSAETINLFFVSATGTGVGTQDDPASLSDALFGSDSGDMVVLLSDILTDTGFTLSPGVSLLGNDGTGIVSVPFDASIYDLDPASQLALGDALTFTTSNTTRPDIQMTNSTLSAITLEGNNLLQDFTVTGGGYGVSSTIGVADLKINNVDLNSQQTAGLYFTNNDNVELSDITVSAVGNNGFGVYLSGGNASISGLSVDSVMGTGLNLNLTGNSTIDTVTLSNVKGVGLSLAANSGAVTVSNSSLVSVERTDNLTGTGVSVSVGDANVKFQNTTIQAENAPLTGPSNNSALTVSGGTGGSVEFIGGEIRSDYGRGVIITGESTNVTLQNLHLGDSQGRGVVLLNVNANVDISSANLVSSVGDALTVSGGTGSITFAGTVANNSGRLLDITNWDGTSADFTNASLTDTGGTGVLVSGGSGRVDFGGLSVSASTSTGMSFLNSNGIYNFSNASITNATSGAIDISGGTAGITFNGGTITNNSGSLLSVDLMTGGSLAFTGTTILDSGLGIGITNSAGDVSVDATSSLSIASTGTAINLLNNTGAYSFNDTTANISSVMDAVKTVNGGTLNLDADLISALSGAAINSSNTVLAINTNTLSSTLSSSSGISISGGEATDTVTVRDSVSIAEAAGHSVELVNTAVDLNLTGVTIYKRGGSGFYADGASGVTSISGWTDTNQSLSALAAIDVTNNIGSISFTDGAVSGVLNRGINLVAGPGPTGNSGTIAYSGDLTGSSASSLVNVRGGDANIALSGVNLTQGGSGLVVDVRDTVGGGLTVSGDAIAGGVGTGLVSGSAGILVSNTAGTVTFDGLEMTALSSGIQVLANTGALVVSNSTFADTTNSAVRVSNSTGNVSVTGNTVTGITAADSISFIDGSGTLSILNNNINTNSSSFNAITVNNANATADQILIAQIDGNIIDGGVSHALNSGVEVTVSGADALTLSMAGNVISNASNSGVDLLVGGAATADVTIGDSLNVNEFHNNTLSAINVGHASSVGANLTVNGNTVVDTGGTNNGIRVSVTGTSQAVTADISNNTVTGVSVNGGGITYNANSASVTTSLIVDNNNVHDNGVAGLSINASNGAKINATVTNNSLINNATVATDQLKLFSSGASTSLCMSGTANNLGGGGVTFNNDASLLLRVIGGSSVDDFSTLNGGVALGSVEIGIVDYSAPTCP